MSRTLCGVIRPGQLREVSALNDVLTPVWRSAMRWIAGHRRAGADAAGRCRCAGLSDGASWPHAARAGAFLLLVMISGAMVLVIDFNRPRDGFTRVDPAPLVWTIQGVAPAPVR